jgi:hypothetical protein
MTNSLKTWWDDPQTDWTSGEPARAAELLARAYERPSTIKPIVGDAGLDCDDAPAASAQEMWTWALREAARERRVLDLVAEVLNDNGSTDVRARSSSAWPPSSSAERRCSQWGKVRCD